MKVRMLIAVTGTRNRKPWPPVGDVIDLPEQEAEDLLWTQIAEGAEPASERLASRLDRLRR